MRILTNPKRKRGVNPRLRFGLVVLHRQLPIARHNIPGSDDASLFDDDGLTVQRHGRADVRRNGEGDVAGLKTVGVGGFDRQMLLVVEDGLIMWDVEQGQPLPGGWVAGYGFVAQVEGHAIARGRLMTRVSSKAAGTKPRSEKRLP